MIRRARRACLHAAWAGAQKNAADRFSMAPMALTTRMARITGPVPYLAASGKQANIPLGPCLVEQGDGLSADIIWGAKGQNSAALPLQEVASAEVSGHLLLLD